MTRYQCPDCHYIYDEARGDDHEGFPPGTPWAGVPESWSCPDCAVRDKMDFVAMDGPSEAVSAPMLMEAVPATPQPAQQVRPVAPPPVPQPAVENDAEKPFLRWVCLPCGHIYDEALGDAETGIAPGTRFEDLPEEWCCPECGATKEAYILDEET